MSNGDGSGKSIYEIGKNLRVTYFYRMKMLMVILLLLTVPIVSNAWGVLGHRVVGGIAEHYLTPKAKAAIKRLLGNETISMASNWADFIKSDRSYDSLGSWHYINLKSGMSDDQLMEYLKKDQAVDLFTKLNLCIRQLKIKTLPVEKQVFFLKMLVHLTGDAHQPMHTARPEDRGGNDIKLYWFNTPTNLHRVWDEHLVEFQQLSYTEYIAAINFANPALVQKWQKQPLSQWVIESYHIADKLYTELSSEDKLTYSYNYNHVALMNQQLLKGGIRLAGLLNSIYSGR
jgi:hypothetical protein